MTDPHGADSAEIERINRQNLADLLRRESRYSGVWFAGQLSRAADLIEAALRTPPDDAAVPAGMMLIGINEIAELTCLLEEARVGIETAFDLGSDPGNISTPAFLESDAADLILRIETLGVAPPVAPDDAVKLREAKMREALEGLARFKPKEHPEGRWSEGVSEWNRAGNYVVSIARAALKGTPND